MVGQKIGIIRKVVKLACVYRTHQIPPFPRMLRQRRTPATMSARVEKSVINVESTSMSSCEARLNMQ